MNWPLVVMSVFLLVGSYALYKANEENRKTNILVKSGVETEAIVVENVREHTRGGYYYTPRFEYHDRFGNTKNAMGDVGSKSPAYLIGEKVKLIYNPNDFDQVKVKSYWGLHGATIISLIVGIVFVSVSAVYFGIKIYRTSN